MEMQQYSNVVSGLNRASTAANASASASAASTTASSSSFSSTLATSTATTSGTATTTTPSAATASSTGDTAVTTTPSSATGAIPKVCTNAKESTPEQIIAKMDEKNGGDAGKESTLEAAESSPVAAAGDEASSLNSEAQELRQRRLAKFESQQSNQ